MILLYEINTQDNCDRKPQPNEEELNEKIFTDVIIARGDINSQ